MNEYRERTKNLESAVGMISYLNYSTYRPHLLLCSICNNVSGCHELCEHVPLFIQTSTINLLCLAVTCLTLHWFIV